MHPADLDTLIRKSPSKAAQLSFRFLRLSAPGILFVSSAAFLATTSSAQDVAEAARQERAQKDSKPKKNKHVYTEQDLKREQILTPEDRAEVEARKNQPASPAEKKSGEAVDAQSLPSDAPLGDVARHFRKQKELRNAERSAQFHLPVTDAPVLATPKPPVMPLRPPVSNPAPPPPKFMPYQPPVKRSPFGRPRVFFAPPVLPMPSHPSGILVTPSQPSRPASPVTPLAGAVKKLNVVTVKQGDSLWKLAEENLGKGQRWHELLAVNPGILDANRIVAGTKINLPVASQRSDKMVKVQKGDTLTKIAQTQLGHASSWSCIAHANPAVQDANVIYEGQSLLIPATCKP
jgi:nucleoid-associated protein YgaU